MTQEEKNLLLKDLCARLPYNVKIETNVCPRALFPMDVVVENPPKPYLRTMSSMTEEEFGFLHFHLPYDFTRIYSGQFNLIDDIHLGNSVSIDDMAFLLDCLNKWHLDYRGLISMGLALKAPDGMYEIKIK